MENIKEDKAKEFLESYYGCPSPDDELEPLGTTPHALQELVKHALEAGKQEREDEIIKELREKLEYYENVSIEIPDFLNGFETAIHVIKPIKLDNIDLENLSK